MLKTPYSQYSAHFDDGVSQFWIDGCDRLDEGLVESAEQREYSRYQENLGVNQSQFEPGCRQEISRDTFQLQEVINLTPYQTSDKVQR